MPEQDIERFIKEIKTSSLRNFTAPAALKSSVPYSGKSIQTSISRSDIPVPELVRFVLAFILRLPTYGPAEKVRWEIPFNYKEFHCTFALEKFGLQLYVSCGEGTPSDTNRVALEIVKKIQQSIHRVEKALLIPFAKQQIESGNITITNQYHILTNRYTYFREKAEKTSKPRKNSRTKSTKGLAVSLNDMVKLKKELFYNTIAMLDAYFSFLEHLFVLVTPLCRDNFRLVDFIGDSWADKYKSLFDIGSAPRAKFFYDKLSNIKERFRNFYAHGAFEKNGASLHFHVPNIGAIPTQLSRVKNSVHFDFFPIQEDNFTNICKTIDDFEKWLQSEESGLAKAIKYVESGLNIPCDKTSIREIKAAMKSEKALNALIEHYSYLYDMHTNMDY